MSGTTKMNLLREYIRGLLKEDPMGFVHDLADAHEEFGEEGQPFFGGDPGKGGGKAIKRAFAANADYSFLNSLDTVHWGGIYGLMDLKHHQEVILLNLKNDLYHLLD